MNSPAESQSPSKGANEIQTMKKTMKYFRFPILLSVLMWGIAASSDRVAPAALPVQDELAPLPPGSVHFEGGFEQNIQNSVVHWSKGVLPYGELVQVFRTSRPMFAMGEMWGKAVRSGAMFYRYTRDPEL